MLHILFVENEIYQIGQYVSVPKKKITLFKATQADFKNTLSLILEF